MSMPVLALKVYAADTLWYPGRRSALGRIIPKRHQSDATSYLAFVLITPVGPFAVYFGVAFSARSNALRSLRTMA